MNFLLEEASGGGREGRTALREGAASRQHSGSANGSFMNSSVQFCRGVCEVLEGGREVVGNRDPMIIYNATLFGKPIQNKWRQHYELNISKVYLKDGNTFLYRILNFCIF